MEYQKVIHFKKNWVEINDDSRGRYNTNSQIGIPTEQAMTAQKMLK